MEVISLATLMDKCSGSVLITIFINKSHSVYCRKKTRREEKTNQLTLPSFGTLRATFVIPSWMGYTVKAFFTFRQADVTFATAGRPFRQGLVSTEPTVWTRGSTFAMNMLGLNKASSADSTTCRTTKIASVTFATRRKCLRYRSSGEGGSFRW